MRLLSTAVFTVMFAAPLFASDPSPEVLEHVMADARRLAEIHHAAPVVFASRTAGGADAAAQEWLVRRRGTVIGGEIAEAYGRVNRNGLALTGFGVPMVDAGGEPDERAWSTIDAAFPGTKSLIVLSRPAFDRLQTAGVVRADFFQKNGEAFTVFFDVEHHPAGAWEVKVRAMDSFARQHGRSAGRSK